MLARWEVFCRVVDCASVSHVLSPPVAHLSFFNTLFFARPFGRSRMGHTTVEAPPAQPCPSHRFPRNMGGRHVPLGLGRSALLQSLLSSSRQQRGSGSSPWAQVSPSGPPAPTAQGSETSPLQGVRPCCELALAITFVLEDSCKNRFVTWALAFFGSAPSPRNRPAAEKRQTWRTSGSTQMPLPPA